MMNTCTCGHEDCVYCEGKLYAGLSKDQIGELRGLLSRHACESHILLFHADEPVEYLYVIRSGQIKIATHDIKGHEHIIGLVGAGYLLGFDTIGHSHYSYSAESLTPVSYCKINQQDMMRVLTENPEVSLNVLQSINEQLSQARNLVRVLGQKTSIEKVASFLLILQPQKSGGGREVRQGLRLSRNEIGEMLGLTMETVSRIMARFRREAIIDAPRGSILIRNRKRLQAFAGEPLPHASLHELGGKIRHGAHNIARLFS